MQELPQLLFSILYMLATQSAGSAFNVVAFIVSLALTTFSTFTILAASGLTCFNACKAIDFDVEGEHKEEGTKGGMKEGQMDGKTTHPSTTQPVKTVDVQSKEGKQPLPFHVTSAGDDLVVQEVEMGMC